MKSQRTTTENRPRGMFKSLTRRTCKGSFRGEELGEAIEENEHPRGRLGQVTVGKPKTAVPDNFERSA
jgi:hypothetical protein